MREQLESMTDAEFAAYIKAQAEELEAAAAKRKQFRIRDTKKLLSLSDNAVGMAAKKFAVTGLEVSDLFENDMTDEAWEAYDLLIHLYYEDWDIEEE